MEGKGKEIVMINSSEPVEEEIQISQTAAQIEGLSSQEMEEEGENTVQKSGVLDPDGVFLDRSLSHIKFHTIDPNKRFVHDEEGGYWMDKDKWPSLELAPITEDAKHEERQQQNVNQENDTNNNQQKGDEGWQTIETATRESKVKRYQPVMAARKSNRTQEKKEGGATSCGASTSGSTEMARVTEEWRPMLH
ncbi:unnamed protein product [Urochloa humidicola]